MRVLMVGAGAVGCVLTRALEQTKGNDVVYFVRRGRKKQLQRIKLLDARTNTITVREKPQVIEAGDPSLSLGSAFDTVVLAVRADQLDEALKIVDELPKQQELRIAIATPGLDDLKLVRGRFPGRPAVRILPGFLAYAQGDAIKWWNPPLSRTLVSFDDDAAAQPFADELATAFTKGGVPSRAKHGRSRNAALASGVPLLGALELAHWSFDDWAKNAELRGLASTGLREGVSAVAPPAVAQLVSMTPQPLVDALLRVAPKLVSASTRAMWSVHGPKIAGQTRQMLDTLIARGHARSRQTGALEELRRRLG